MKSVHTLSLPRWGKVAHREKNMRLLLDIGGVTDEVVLKAKQIFSPFLWEGWHGGVKRDIFQKNISFSPE